MEKQFCSDESVFKCVEGKMVWRLKGLPASIQGCLTGCKREASATWLRAETQAVETLA